MPVVSSCFAIYNMFDPSTLVYLLTVDEILMFYYVLSFQ